MFAQPDPRKLAISALILGVVSILVGLYELFHLHDLPFGSSPWPKFTDWLTYIFGVPGEHLLVILITFSFALLAFRYAWRTLTPQSRADGPEA